MAIECPLRVEKDIGMAVGQAVLDWVEKGHRGIPNAIGRMAASHELGARLLSLIAPVCRVRDDVMDRMRRRERPAAVIRHMHEHLDRPVRRNELADMAGFSPAQFHVVFAEVTGTSPMTYLRRLRMQRAQQMLMVSTMPVKEVAERCGYGDQFVFCKFFKHQQGGAYVAE
jgi:AraC-like DNA-binding protein